jgi:hypothetical protein
MVVGSGLYGTAAKDKHTTTSLFFENGALHIMPYKHLKIVRAEPNHTTFFWLRHYLANSVSI